MREREKKIKRLTGTRAWIWGWKTSGGWWVRRQFKNDKVSIFILELEFLSLKKIIIKHYKSYNEKKNTTMIQKYLKSINEANV